jgi:hypothetical protein
VDLTLRLASLGCHKLREPSEQSHHHGYVLAHTSESWESIIILNDFLVHIMSTRVHLVTVLCDLMLELCALLLQMESCSFELLL